MTVVVCVAQAEVIELWPDRIPHARRSWVISRIAWIEHQCRRITWYSLGSELLAQWQKSSR